MLSAGHGDLRSPLPGGFHSEVDIMLLINDRANCEKYKVFIWKLLHSNSVNIKSNSNSYLLFGTYEMMSYRPDNAMH